MKNVNKELGQNLLKNFEFQPFTTQVCPFPLSLFFR